MMATLIGMPFDRAGGELLVGHLEAAVAVDGPDGRVRPADLGAHRGRHGVAHRAEAAGVEPGARLLVRDELRRPHLVLADAGDVERVRAGDLAEPLDDVLRRERPVVRLARSRAGRSRATGRAGPTSPRSRRWCPAACSACTAAISSAMTSRQSPDDRHVGGAVLADLGRVDVGVDDLARPARSWTACRSPGRRSGRRAR